MIDFEKRNNKKQYQTYRIRKTLNEVQSIVQCNHNDQIYTSKGYYRRANVKNFNKDARKHNSHTFTDPNFELQVDDNLQFINERLSIRRLYDVYEKQQPIFANLKSYPQSFLDYKQNYCTFSTELGLIDPSHLQTIFITRNINKQGYYEYFVRRNGQYHVQFIDDTIPVQGLKLSPLWGMSYRCPWEQLLLKAWIKQKNGLTGVIQAEPFQFLSAFGLPGYSKKNITKQLNFIKNEHSRVDLKKRKEQRIPLNIPRFSILAKTRNDKKIEQLGLIKNCLGYRIIPVKPSKSLIQHQKGQNTIYKIHSSIPSKWVGSLSVVKKDQILKSQNFDTLGFNLEKQFLATQQQVLAIFSKYYIAKDFYADYKDKNIYQDSYVVDNAKQDQPMVFKLHVAADNNDAVMNINIQFFQDRFRRDKEGHKRWPYIKYFLSKVVNPNKTGTSKIPSQRNIQVEEPNLFKYEYFDIDFIKGYHRSANRFLNIQAGQYLLYVKIQHLLGADQVDYAINISSSAQFNELKVQNLSPFQLRELVDSTIFSYAKSHGQKYIRDKVQKIYLGNTFKQIGFGFLGLQLIDPVISDGSSLIKSSKSPSKSPGKKATKTVINPADYQLGIRVQPKQLKKLRLANYYYQESDGSKSTLERSQQPITMISRYGLPKIIVLESPAYDFQLTEEFPQKDSIEVYSLKQAQKK